MNIWASFNVIHTGSSCAEDQAYVDAGCCMLNASRGKMPSPERLVLFRSTLKGLNKVKVGIGILYAY